MQIPQTQHPITPTVSSIASLLRNSERPVAETRLLLWEAALESDTAFVMLAANLRHNGLDLGYCVGEAIERFVPILYAASLITLGAQERRDGDVWAVLHQIEELPRVGAQVASGLVGEGLSYEDLLQIARVWDTIKSSVNQHD